MRLASPPQGLKLCYALVKFRRCGAGSAAGPESGAREHLRLLALRRLPLRFNGFSRPCRMFPGTTVQIFIDVRPRGRICHAAWIRRPTNAHRYAPAVLQAS